MKITGPTLSFVLITEICTEGASNCYGAHSREKRGTRRRGGTSK